MGTDFDIPLPGERPVVTALIETLFQTYARQLSALFRRRLGRDADIDDLVQDVYVQMLRADDSEIRNPVAYLFAVAENSCKKRARELGRRRKQIDVDDPVVQEEFAAIPNLEVQLDDETRRRRTSKALHELSPKCQAVAAMHYGHGMNYAEIAAVLEVSPNMVKKYVMHALAHFRRRTRGLR